MKTDGVIWIREIVEKLASKHHVEPDEVEQVLNSQLSREALILSARDMARKERRIYGKK